ncbi:MAG: His/Gly/Thr/Pro-type tRNA ligase C-terminal domain-containing protein [Candidatus Gracilibacteria bacterium]
MLKLSNFPIKTLKTRPHISDNISTGILLQAGFIRQTMAGVYNYTTLGLKVLRNIENVVREEMDAYGAAEILMSALSPKENWEKTGRWDLIDVLFKLPTGSEGKEYGLNSTHEEIVTPLMSEFLTSYKDSGSCVYQIQTKFRNEKRAKSGLLRGREFIMKDAYSFHIDGGKFDEYYEGMKDVYMKIFDRLGLLSDTYITLADGGDFTDKYSHEFQVVLPIGEDNIYICDECRTSHNEEVIDKEKGFKCTNCSGSNHRIEKASEVGNIFPLETKFSKPFGLKMGDKNNKEQDVLMGCYGIGISRLMGVIAEYFMGEKGINWPENIAPADYYIIVIGEGNIEKATEIAKNLEIEGKEVILDDRMNKKIGFGQKAGDSELFGIPNRIVVSPKTIEQGGYELLKRGEKAKIIKF